MKLDLMNMVDDTNCNLLLHKLRCTLFIVIFLELFGVISHLYQPVTLSTFGIGISNAISPHEHKKI